MTFQVIPRTPGDLTTADVCPTPSTSPRSIVFAHPKGCVEELRIIRPWAVACAGGRRPPGRGCARRRDPRHSGDERLYRSRRPADEHGHPAGHVRRRLRGPRRRDARVRPRCSPMTSATAISAGCSRSPAATIPPIEIRRDMSALFVLVDLDGELVVIRASSGGLRRGERVRSALERLCPGDETELRHVLGLITGIQFGQRPDLRGSCRRTREGDEVITRRTMAFLVALVVAGCDSSAPPVQSSAPPASAASPSAIASATNVAIEGVITVDPQEVEIGEPVSIRLPASPRNTMSRFGRPRSASPTRISRTRETMREAEATFQTDASGGVDLTTRHPSAGRMPSPMAWACSGR